MRLVSRLKSYAGHRAREAALYPTALRRRQAPRIIFFPSSVKEGASLLRAYNIAAELRQMGWQTLVVPAQLELVQRKRLIRIFRPDALFFQQCRHALNDAAFSFDVPFVLDIDDADFLSPHMHDRLARTCREARGVIAGSRFVADWCRQHNARTTIVWTGTPLHSRPRPNHADRPPVIAWAQASPTGYPAELEFVRRVHERLTARGAQFQLRLYGIDDAVQRQDIVERFGGATNIETRPLMDYDAFLSSLQDVAIGLSPIISSSPFSRGKSFGKILGYLDAKVPVIASDEADHALFFSARSGVVSNDPDAWIEAALALLADPERRNAMANAAFEAYRHRLSTRAAAQRVDGFLRDLGLHLPAAARSSPAIEAIGLSS